LLVTSKNQKLATGTGIHSCTSGLGKVGKTVFLQEYQREPFVKRSSHYGFLTKGYGRGDEHCSLTGCFQKGVHSGFDFRFGEAS